MSDLRKAAQDVVTVWKMYGTAESLRGWMEILEAALAQEQPEPVCKCDLRTRLVGDGCEVCNPELAAELAQEPEPAQEPVAWNWMLDGRPYGQVYYGNPPDADIAERAAIAGRTVRILYTAPPQRQDQRVEKLEAQRDALKQTLHEELNGNLRLRDLGGARPDEPMLTFLERIIAERDALLAALKAMLEQFNYHTITGLVHDESAAIAKARAAIKAAEEGK